LKNFFQSHFQAVALAFQPPYRERGFYTIGLFRQGEFLELFS